MGRFLAASAVVAALALATAGAVPAFQCPTLIHSIYADAGVRFDTGAYDARAKAAEAARVHAEGRHADAQKIALEGRRLLVVTEPPQPTR